MLHQCLQSRRINLAAGRQLAIMIMADTQALLTPGIDQPIGGAGVESDGLAVGRQPGDIGDTAEIEPGKS